MDMLTRYKLRRGIKRILLALAIVMVLSAAAGILLFAANRFTLDIQLEGEQEVVLDYADPYIEQGANPVVQGSLLMRESIPADTEVKISGSVNTNIVGTYQIIYSASYGEMEAEVIRTVHVVDKKSPRITLTTLTDHYTAYGEPYAEEGFSAFDEYDGDLTDQVAVTEKDGFVTYSVSDTAGNRTQVRRKILYYDPVAPTVALQGAPTVTLSAGEPYIEPGYSAADNVDGDLTDRVEISGELDTYLTGTYQLTYSVTDDSGNTTHAKRTVVVQPQPKMEEVLPEGKIIYLTFDDGPSAHTQRLLEILEKHEVKVTFFLCNTDYIDTAKDIVEKGHSVAIHSVTHRYADIYASTEAYFADLHKMQGIIKEKTGVETKLVRFPGGSSNTVSRFNEGIMTKLSKAVEDTGLKYFDWNVDSNDAGGAKTSEEVFNNVVNGLDWAMDYYGFGIVLQHDTQEFSVEAVDEIITWGKENGYTFLPLQNDSPTVHHIIAN